MENPVRIKILTEAFANATFPLTYYTAASASPKEIKKIHDLKLFNTVKSSQSKGGHTFTEDTVANRYTYQASLTAVGGSIQAAMNLKRNHSFAMLRPPGHHATREEAMGFCFFNNIAIATQHLLDNRSKKIAILDIDNHHGNGSQQVFYSNPNVLFTSLHANPNISFPSTGYADEIGSEEGEGYTVNIPLPFQINDDDYLFAFDTIIEPIVKQFKPDTILVSLGFDSLLNDPYGALGLSPEAFSELGYRIGKINDNQTKNKVGFFLEGGYKYEEMGTAALNFFHSLLNSKDYSKSRVNPSQKIQRVVHNIRSIQRNYWYAI